MENNIYSDELQHHGTKGMRWGIRRYQNPDGTLTPAGKKRYNKEVAKLKAEEAKIKAAEKVASNKAKTQAKFDKLDAKKQDLERRKKALKGKTQDDSDSSAPEETIEQKRARLLKSSDPKEIMKDKDVLSNFELQDRVNRINLEAQLNSKIPAEPEKPTILDRVDKTTNAVTKATNLYKSVDNAFSTVSNSFIGKTLAENLGIELPKKEKSFDLGDFVKNINKKSDEELQKTSQRLQNQKNIMKEYEERNKPKTEDTFDVEDFYKNIKTKSNQEVAEAAKRVGNETKIKNAISSAGNTAVNNGTSKTNVDDIESLVRDAVDEIMAERNKG